MADVSLRENDFRAAFESLKTSTAAIEKHEKVLAAQKEALLAFRPQTQALTESNSLSQQHDQESGRLVFALDDLLHSTRQQLTEAEQQSSHAISNLNSVATGRLASDDQVLEALSTIASQTLRPEKPSVEIGTVESWCRTLASLREQEAKAHVEAIYHDQIVRDAQNEDAEKAPSSTKEQRQELHDELQTLRDEIGSIVQMVIGHEIRDPLLRNLQTHESDVRQSRNDWSDYVTSTLEHLIAQLETMSDHAVDLRSYSSAIHEFHPLVTATEAEATVQGVASKEALLSPTETSRSKFLETRSATTSAIPQVLRRLDHELVSTGDRSKIMAALDAAATDGTAKLRAQYATAESARLETLEKSLGEKQRDMRAITQRIYANSEQDNIQLSDKTLDAKLLHLNQSVDDVAAALEKASLSRKEQSVAKGAALKSRWL